MSMSDNEEIAWLRARLAECEAALKNMVGYFGGADIKLRLGKQWTAEHTAIVKEAKRLLDHCGDPANECADIDKCFCQCKLCRPE